LQAVINDDAQMNTLHKRRIIYSLPLGLLLFILGCQVSGQSTPGEETTIGTQIHSSTPSSAIKATSTPTTTSELSLTNTPTASPSSTWTPLPTLAPDQVIIYINKLLDTNGGCELPCWWGISLGVTSWEEAEHFLKSFATRVASEGIFTLRENGEYFRISKYSASYPVSEQEEGALIFSIKEGIVDVIEISPHTVAKHFTLSQILKKLGRPTQIYISTYRDSPDDFIPFSLIIYYQDNQLLAYFETNAIVCPDMIRGCFSENQPRIWLWSPDEIWAEDQILERTLLGGSEGLKQLDQVSNYTTQIFYETFSDPETAECIETPKDLW
jgi:hypothetical protein